MLGVVDGDVGDAARAVAGEHRTRHLAQHARRRLAQPQRIRRTRGRVLRVLDAHRAAFVDQRDAAVLGHDRGHRPVTCERLAPAHRPARHRDHRHAGGMQLVERATRGGGDRAIRGERVVDVGQHPDHVACGRGRERSPGP